MIAFQPFQKAASWGRPMAFVAGAGSPAADPLRNVGTWDFCDEVDRLTNEVWNGRQRSV